MCARAIQPGRLIDDRYEVLEKIGAGGHGVVYQARQQSTGQIVAMKVLRPQSMGLEGAIGHVQSTRFQREMKLIAQLKHPNIVRLIDSGQLEDELYIVLEFVEGTSLKAILKNEGALSPKESKHLMFQVLEALSCAHAQGIVHRDLKPANIMVTSSGYRRSAMVLDFGIAGILEEKRDADYVSVTNEDVLSGTPAYMAPEQIKGEVLTPASDLYSWGLVFIECLTGERALPGRDAVEILRAHISPKPLPIADTIEGPLRDFLTKVTSREVDDRFASTDEALATLEPIRVGPRTQDLEALDVGALQEDTAETMVDARHPLREALTEAKVEEARLTLVEAHAPSSEDDSRTGETRAKDDTSGEDDDEETVKVVPPTRREVERDALEAAHLTMSPQMAARKRTFRIVLLIGAVALVALAVFVVPRLLESPERSADDEGGATTQDAPTSQRPLNPPRSLVILPFELNDDTLAYLADGLAEELIFALSRVPDLRVIARSLAFAYQDSTLDTMSIAEELQVDAVLESQLALTDTQTTLTMTLIDTRNGSVLWMDRLQVQDALSTQATVSETLLDVLELDVEQAPQPARSSDAHTLYLQGRYHWNQRDEASLALAADYYEQALEIAPDDAPLHASLADLYNVQAYYSWRDPRDAYEKARTSANRALELDANLAQAYGALANVYLYFDLDWANAEEAFKTCVALNPEYASCLQWYGSLILVPQQRWDEALVSLQAAFAVDPISPIIQADIGERLFFMRDYERAIAHFEALLEMHPNFIVALAYLGRSYAALGQRDDALAILERAQERSDSSTYVLTTLGIVHAQLGDTAIAETIVAQLIERRETRVVQAAFIARLYAALGQTEDALTWLEKALDERSPTLIYLRIDSAYDSLREDPRFQDVLVRAGHSTEH